MSSNARSKKKSSNSINQVMEQAVQTSKRRSTSAVKEEKEQSESSKKFANIQNNTFYGIVLDPSLTPADKKNAVTQALTFTNNKDDAKEKLEEFNQFKEFLQHERKRMAQEIITLTDTGAFSELKSVYDEINNALISFETKITPLTDIVDAVYTLRMNGVTFDVFREIAEDKEAEAKLALLREQQEQELQLLTNTLTQKKNQIAILGQDKSWFGFGDVTRASREKIAVLELEIKGHTEKLAKLTQAIADTPERPQNQSNLVEYADQKAKLRELLDISSTEHKDRQKDLVTAAQEFIKTTEVRVGKVSEHFDMMNNQIDNLNEANFSMREIYAIINDATKDADKQNEVLRDTLQPDDPNEGDIERMTRERHKRDLENHIKALGSSAVDTTTVLAELTSSGHRIKSMQDANDQQISRTRQLHSSGVAGVADQLSTVLQAVSSAALGESSEMARMSLERMQQTTTALGQKEVIRVALGTQEQNSELSKALEDLEQYGQVIETATSITRDGLLETKDLLSRLESTAKDVQASVQESISVAADVTSGKYDDEQKAQQPQKQAEASPFGF